MFQVDLTVVNSAIATQGACVCVYNTCIIRDASIALPPGTRGRRAHSLPDVIRGPETTWPISLIPHLIHAIASITDICGNCTREQRQHNCAHHYFLRRWPQQMCTKRIE